MIVMVSGRVGRGTVEMVALAVDIVSDEVVERRKEKRRKAE